MKIFYMLPVIALAGLVAGSAAAADGISLEYGTDRAGSDYRDFDLAPGAGPKVCMRACKEDDQCRAFTYVKAGVQGDNPRCWLKNTVPQASASDCCVSGVKPAGGNGGPDGISLEYGTDRAGSDYRDFDLAPGAGPKICMRACADEAQCRAFTYVKAGVQGANPRCWLKNTVPQASASDCCVSGVKPADTEGEPDGISLEYSVNRHGSDYRDFAVSNGDGLKTCQQACEDEEQCRAFTYVKAGAQGASAHCWLKNTVPQAYADERCISGVKE